MRTFVGIDLGREPVPDESTILNYHHLMERHNPGNGLFRLVTVYLEENGMKVARGTIDDASNINAPSSTRNKDKDKKSDPEMHQTKKGNRWYFGIKLQVGADVNSGAVHTVSATPANAPDMSEMPNLLREDDRSVLGDAAT